MDWKKLTGYSLILVSLLLIFLICIYIIFKGFENTLGITCCGSILLFIILIGVALLLGEKNEKHESI